MENCKFVFAVNSYLIKIRIISIEKIRNSGNYIYDYAHSFFGKDFNPSRYTGLQIDGCPLSNGWVHFPYFS